jgi:choline kinase|tara:strand:+ start:192 stop:992 length:801 start_codon:yes stop_codon:yes gene_type:complete
MLAAGIGARLGVGATKDPPKALLRFGDKSLLQFHIEILKRQGIDELALGVGYHHQDIEREIVALGAQDYVRTVFNEDYEEGNIVTLWTIRDELCCEKPVLLMDADVLYDEEMVERLVNSPHQNCLLLDRAVDQGDEPVKVCVRDGEIVEFRKWHSAEFDICGESVGFFKLSAEVAKKLIMQAELYLHQGRRHESYEEAIRDVLLTSPRGTFAFEDITGLPWIEIDFAADIERANVEVLPRILTADADRRASRMIKRGMSQDAAPRQ